MNQTSQTHIGTSGWHYEHWEGPFYPAEIAIRLRPVSRPMAGAGLPIIRLGPVSRPRPWGA
jgi:hypothetical protein